MRRKKIIAGVTLIAAALAILLVAGCGSMSQGSVKVAISPKDFESESAGLLTISNFSSADVAIFAGKVERGAYMGAIRNDQTRRFDLEKLSLPDKGAFILRAVLAAAWQTKQNAVTTNDVVYTNLVVYNRQDDERIQLVIPKEIDTTMSSSVMVSNNTGTVLQLRLNSPNDPVLAALAPFERNKQIWISPNNMGLPYMLFSEFVSVDPDGKTKSTIETMGQNMMPAQRGSDMMFIDFDKKTDPDEPRLNLLFE